jgi:hypothetical protein
MTKPSTEVDGVFVSPRAHQVSPKDTKMRTNWRITPPPWLGEAVRNLASSEGRTQANMLLRLVSEAVQTRRAIEARTVEAARLESLIRGEK